jgi:hypothetical protein
MPVKITCRSKCESQEFESFNLDHLALLMIDLELDLLGQVVTSFSHHPSPCPSTFDQNHQVIHITDKVPVVRNLQNTTPNVERAKLQQSRSFALSTLGLLNAGSMKLVPVLSNLNATTEPDLLML